jgi:predicted alpha/beta hydrolase
MTVREPLEITCADGWRLRGELVLPASPRAVAIVGHAMMVDRRTLDRPRGRGLVSALAEAGVAVIWPDLRGHGNSGPRPDEGGRWRYDDLVEHDVPALLDLARSRLPGLRVALVGHSLFGHVALAHLARHEAPEVASLVLLACNVANPTWRARPWQWRKKRALLAVMQLSALLFGYVPARRLGVGSDDEPAELAQVFSDWARRAEWRAEDGFSYYDALPELRVPVHAFVGSADRLLAPPCEVRALLARLPGATVREVGRRSGLAFDPGHMALVLDERARPVWQEIAVLCGGRLA